MEAPAAGECAHRRRGTSRSLGSSRQAQSCSGGPAAGLRTETFAHPRTLGESSHAGARRDKWRGAPTRDAGLQRKSVAGSEDHRPASPHSDLDEEAVVEDHWHTIQDGLPVNAGGATKDAQAHTARTGAVGGHECKATKPLRSSAKPVRGAIHNRIGRPQHNSHSEQATLAATPSSSHEQHAPKPSLQIKTKWGEAKPFSFVCLGRNAL